MTAAGVSARATGDRAQRAGEGALGWYLYGITRSGRLPATLDHAASLQLLESSGLAAVVSRVPLAEFSPDALHERLQNPSDLEALVRSHNRVIEAVHALQAILPAKLAMVYGHEGDILSALRTASDSLLPQLRRLEGCDEWAVHLYADPTAVRNRISVQDPAIKRVRDDVAAATPGRAYFLERQLQVQLEAATRDALMDLAQHVFDRLSACAVAGQVNAAGPVDDATGDVEILRAAFLVARDDIARFEAEMGCIAAASEGLRCDSTGPWPPYSFAAHEEGDER